MLEYENQLFLDAIHESQLFIFARGLSTEKVLTNLFQLYANDAHLVFVLSTSTSEELYFHNKLSNEKLISITTEFNANQRKELYVGGGVFFITSRILIVDFLKNVIPSEKISGLIILRAHNVIESSQEAFILRLYRTNNKTGFIKAFSSSPTRFLLGFSKINTIMRCCFLSNVSLWPRFHSSVKESLKYEQEDDDDHNTVIEIQLKLTPEMIVIQSNLLDLVTCSINELKQLIPSLNDEDITSELALTKNFEKIIHSYIDPIWNTITAKSKEILNDLKIFRLLLTILTKNDCINFYSILCNYTSHDAGFKSSWVLSKSAENIIQASKIRLLPLPPPPTPTPTPSSLSTTSDSTTTRKSTKSTIKNKFQPEICPKWLALSEILNEICIKQEKIEEIQYQNITSRLKTIIFVDDIKTCNILRDYLSLGSEITLGKIVRNCNNIKIELPPELIFILDNINKKNKCTTSKTTNIQGGGGGGDGKNNNEIQTTLTQIERKYDEVEFLQNPIFIIPIKNFGNTEAYNVSETLDTIRPDVIIIFDPELELIRNIEIHRGRIGKNQNIRVYFLVYRNSIEEQIYLTSIQREKLAFEKLIQEKSTMVIPKEREGKDELNQDLWRDPTKASDAVSTSGQSKRNMEQKSNEREIILVDMREFRSELPSLIHKRGIDLEPLTLDIGDYILTPDICVERKSISDLIGSLNSGRLYKQAEAMERHYKKPVLLIEHETNASRRNQNDLSQIMPKLQLLTINFPNLKIIWSPGPHYTSEIFHELKRGKDEPNPIHALSITKESIGITVSKYNTISHSFLSKLPGINSQNVYNILSQCSSLDELCNCTQEQLSNILQNNTLAHLLYSGIHSTLNNNNNSGNEIGVGKSKQIKSTTTTGGIRKQRGGVVHGGGPSSKMRGK